MILAPISIMLKSIRKPLETSSEGLLLQCWQQVMFI